jgi:hypothetical protein
MFRRYRGSDGRHKRIGMLDVASKAMHQGLFSRTRLLRASD